MINRRALFADETADYKTPYEPKQGDRVCLRLRALKNDVLEAYAIINGTRRAMKSQKKDELFEYFTISFRCGKHPYSYHFEVRDEDDEVYFNRLGAVENVQEEYNFSFTPNFTVPEWAKGCVYYQIFPDRFCNGNPQNDVRDNEYYYVQGHSRHIDRWDKIPDTLDVNNFYGGDLQGIEQKLDYLQSLGVDSLYLNPIFVSPSNHKYDTQDFENIDPHLAIIQDDEYTAMQHWEKHNGYAPRYIRRTTKATNLEASNAYFASLVEKLHARGIKVVIDGVFNHCGSFNKWLDREGIYLGKEDYEKGAWQDLESPYRSYFRFKKKDVTHSPYEGWWDYATLPKLNYEGSEALVENILNVGKKWVSAPYNVDGWRLDVAADLGHSERFNHKFWQRFRESVRSANENAVIFAEHYGNPTAWLNGKEWDSVMNYDAFMEPVSWFLTGMEKHSESFDAGKLHDGVLFFDSIFKNMATLPRPALDSALNQLSNHDHSRFLTRTNRTVGRLHTKGGESAGHGIDRSIMGLAVLLQMTWPGAPGVYYGDEAGQVGWTDPDNRRTYPWGKENAFLLDYHKKAIALRKSSHALKRGSIKRLDAGNGYIAYGRFDENEAYAVVINCSDRHINLNVPVWELGVPRESAMQCEFFSQGEQFVKGEQVEIKHGRLFVSLPAKSGCVYSYHKK